MTRSPTFASIDAYRAGRRDVDLWRPHVEVVRRRHGLDGAPEEPEAGGNPTYPTFLVGEVVVKFFGVLPRWRETFDAERAAHAWVATDPGLAAPHVLAEGRLVEDAWPYLVTTRLSGASLRDADLSEAERLAVAKDLGRQVGRIHALPTAGFSSSVEESSLDVCAAARDSSLPEHLAVQAEAFVRDVPSSERVFVHGDLCAMHAFVADGRLEGIIDWGDATVADRHYELIQIYRDTLDGDPALFRAFLDAADWPVGEDFPRRTLAQALVRQATGLIQHLGMDVFEPIAAEFALDEIPTLDDLAALLFDVYGRSSSPPGEALRASRRTNVQDPAEPEHGSSAL